MSKFKPQYRRLLHIDRTIRAGEYPNCSRLAREWETSTRTMQRDIDYLKYELDAPIEYDPLKRGFFYADPSWFLPSVMLSEGELLALLIGREALNMYRGTPVAGQLQQVYGKLSELLPDQISMGPEFIQARFSFFNAPSRTMDPAIWKVILRGLLRQQVVDITYRSPAAPRPKPHRLHPYHVLNLEGEWYLLAHNERWDGLRQYALPRVKSATLTDHRFSIPEDFDIKDALQARFGRYLHHDGKKPATVVKLSIAPALATYITEKEWHPKQKLVPRKNGTVELHLPVADTLDVESWVLSLGEHVTVLAPASLKTRIRQRHRIAARKA